MIPAQIIKFKRDGRPLTEKQIKEFVGGFVAKDVADYQMTALLMAIFLNGMNDEETLALTQAMLHSGDVVDFGFIKGRKIDKHSTGGVGDKTSLIIGPIAAAAGVYVPMISGRGLGHTGGTLDKLESIPGFSTQLSMEQFKKQVADLGLCFIGQTQEICPADKRMYALRDVTGTVECIPLICASIMSKKLAEGIDGLVLDVKVGSGAFMKTERDAKRLAQGLVAIAKGAKKSVTALVTDMNQPLGYAIGNALEVQECLDVLRGEGPEDLKELSLELAAQMIWLGKKSKTLVLARKVAGELLATGKALQNFEAVVRAQGGNLAKLPGSQKTKTIFADKKGYISRFDVEKIGLASLALGAGRRRAEDVIDMGAGLVMHKKIGDAVAKGEKLWTLHFENARKTSETEEMLHESVEIRLQKVRAPRLIKSVVAPEN